MNRIQTFKNDLILRSLRGETVDRTPVWMMRQAGRYLSEYRKLREKYSFFQRVQTPELACEITLQPVDIVDVDAAILFSDILVVPQAMGLEVQLVPGKGPFLPEPIKSANDLNRISVPDVSDSLHYVFDAIGLIQSTLNGRVPLIGFAGGPWTLFCYMVQGEGSKTFDQAKSFCFAQPETAHRLLEKITKTTIAYLKGQVAAGADVLQVFDSWAGLLSPDDFQTFCLPYLRSIVDSLKEDIPVIIFAKGVWYGLEEMAKTGAAGLGVDWCLNPQQARDLAGGNVTLQGNLDPAKLLAPIPQIKKDVQKMMKAFGRRRYIANLGHGMLPNIPVDHAKAFVDAVKEYSAVATE